MTRERCGHSAYGNGVLFVCDKPKGHGGLHEQKHRLRDRVERTNWGDDGLAAHATKYPDARKGVPRGRESS